MPKFDPNFLKILMFRALGDSGIIGKGLWTCISLSYLVCLTSGTERCQNQFNIWKLLSDRNFDGDIRTTYLFIKSH